MGKCGDVDGKRISIVPRACEFRLRRMRYAPLRLYRNA